jgi:hypothetical protein
MVVDGAAAISQMSIRRMTLGQRQFCLLSIAPPVDNTILFIKKQNKMFENRHQYHYTMSCLFYGTLYNQSQCKCVVPLSLDKMSIVQ